MTYLEHQLVINEATNKTNEIKSEILEINEKGNTKKLKDYLKSYKQKEKVDFINYKTNINMEQCKQQLLFFYSFSLFPNLIPLFLLLLFVNNL